MANVKVRSGIVRNAVGVPMTGKPAQLINATTLATIGAPVNTDVNGRYTFAGLDETVRYSVSVAFGGGSNQVHVNSPISPDLDDAYINVSLRSAPGATVAFGGPVSVGGTLSLTAGLTVGGALNVTGNATVNGVISTDGDMVVNGIVNAEGLSVGGGAFIVGGGGAVTATAPATFGDVGASQLGITAGGQIRLPINTMATPPIASATDLDTGIRLPGSNQGMLVANGQEIARFWMNGAVTQFASYATQTYIGSQILMGGTQAATSVAGVVRAFAVRDGSGNILGWTPIYGAVN